MKWLHIPQKTGTGTTHLNTAHIIMIRDGIVDNEPSTTVLLAGVAKPLVLKGISGYDLMANNGLNIELHPDIPDMYQVKADK